MDVFCGVGLRLESAPRIITLRPRDELVVKLRTEQPFPYRTFSDNLSWFLRTKEPSIEGLVLDPVQEPNEQDNIFPLRFPKLGIIDYLPRGAEDAEARSLVYHAIKDLRTEAVREAFYNHLAIASEAADTLYLRINGQETRIRDYPRRDATSVATLL